MTWGAGFGGFGGSVSWGGIGSGIPLGLLSPWDGQSRSGEPVESALVSPSDLSSSYVCVYGPCKGGRDMAGRGVLGLDPDGGETTQTQEPAVQPAATVTVTAKALPGVPVSEQLGWTPDHSLVVIVALTVLVFFAAVRTIGGIGGRRGR